MIHFDFGERYEDEHVVGTAISRREGTLLSLVAHALFVLALIFAPRLSVFQQRAEQRAEALKLQEQRAQNRTFVFVRPRADLESPKPPPRAEMSDKDRVARAPKQAPNPANMLPYSQGNSTQRTEESKMARAGTPEPTPGPPSSTPGLASTQDTQRVLLPESETGYTRPQETARLGRGGSALGEALKNLQRYTQNETFDNPQGSSQQPGAAIQFDTKGVEFGPWIRRFVAQVKRNWFVPTAAWIQRGHVVLQFNIHKDGHITDIAVVAPSGVDAFNKAAFNAILTSNPTEPLPPEYPSDKALFTVTFYYNEQPPAF